MNEELQNRMTELGQFKDDLYNIMEGLHAAVLLVNMDVRVRYISPAASAILGLAGGEVGRPLGHLLPKEDRGALERLVWDVIQSLQPREQDLVATSGRHYRSAGDAVPELHPHHQGRGGLVLPAVEWRRGRERPGCLTLAP